MRVYILADFESVAGAVHPRQVIPGEQEYESFQRVWMGELSAAIGGATLAGATDIVVGEAHWENRNILPEWVDPRAEYISGLVKRNMQLGGLDSSYGAVFMFIHSMSGTRDGVLAHTHTPRHLRAIRMNGVAVGELGMNAALAQELDVPVRLVIGDSATVREARALIPGVEAVVTKTGIGQFVARWRPPEEVKREIAEAAERSLRNPAPVGFSLSRPIDVELELASPTLVELCGFIPGVKALGDDTVAFQAKTVEEAYHFIFVCAFLAQTPAVNPPVF